MGIGPSAHYVDGALGRGLSKGAAQRRARRLATYDQVWTLHRQGWSPRAIAQQLGMGRWPVVRYLQAPSFPECKGRSDKGKSLLTPYKLKTDILFSEGNVLSSFTAFSQLRLGIVLPLAGDHA
jgi:hypothetical protein